MTSTKPPQERVDQKFNLQFGLQIIIMIIFLQARSSEGVSPKEASRLNGSIVDHFERVGCFWDKKSKRALPILLHTFAVNWTDMNNSYSKIIRACAVNVSKAGFRYFGIQHYKECWSGVNGSVTYNKYGRNNNCDLLNGIGKSWSNFVYRFVEVNGSWSHWSPWQPCNSTCGGGYRSRVRTCTNPRPKWNGLDCNGSSISNGSCNVHSCADHEKSEPFSKRSSLPLVGLWLGISLVVLLCLSGILWITLRFSRKRRSNSELVDPFEIVFDDISLCNLIGEGAFGKVFSAELNKQMETGKEGKSSVAKTNKQKLPKQKYRIVAVKMLRGGATEEQKEEFLEEIKLMKLIGYHRHVLNLLACCTNTVPMFLVTEFAKYGDLLNFLRKRREQIKQAIEEMEAAKLYQSRCCNLGLSTSEANLYDSTDDIDKYTTGLGSFCNKNGYGSNLKTDPHILYEDDTLRPADLLAFAWQIAQAMVRDWLCELNLYSETVGHSKLICSFKISLIFKILFNDI